MATYNFDYAPAVAKYSNDGTVTAVGVFNLTAALADNDVITGIPVPSGAVITNVTLHTTELDTNGSPTLTLNVGDAADEDRFIDGATTGAAANNSTVNVTPTTSSNVPTNGVGYEYTADGTIIITVDGAPATGATSGVVTLAVTYTNNAF